MKEIDYYAVLNIRRDASPEEIALAYRKLAVQHHPLRNQKQNASSSLATFINEINHLPALPSSTIWEYVNKAYDILCKDLFHESEYLLSKNLIFSKSTPTSNL